MRCPTLKELSPPPPNKTGWPWTEESPQLPDTMPDGSLWPRISIVTPSLNQGQFIEETIRSVLLQGYPNLEHIIIDGGSKDGSVEIIKKYEKWLVYWITEPDNGQSHAINKGLLKSTGIIFAWINSDDIYLNGTLKIVGQQHRANQNSIIAGDVVNFDNHTGEEYIFHQKNITLEYVIKFWKVWVERTQEFASWHQPGLFFPANLIKEIGLLDETLLYSLDYDILCNLLTYCKVKYTSNILSKFRIHKDSKSIIRNNDIFLQSIYIYQRYSHLLENIDDADVSLSNFLSKKASYQLRTLNVKFALQLLISSWQTTHKYTIIAIIKELKRLLLGGRYTGRT